MAGARYGRWVGFITVMMLSLLIMFSATTTTDAFDVGITYLQDAVGKGAVCLDGSPPAYHMDKGFGAGINNWILYFEGGGWCNNATTCLERRDTRLGSSKQMTKVLSFSGIFSNKLKYNPDFYNWNRIKVRYCDGASYTGDVEAVDPKTKVYYRGARIFKAVIDDMLSKGMKNAQNVMLAGCSAGGLATILNCDRFRSLMPPTAKVKCMADAGYFINAKTIAGTSHIQEFYSQVVATHAAAKNLPTSCTSRLAPGLCFFPENVIQEIKTPIFILNAAYDSWQVKNILAPGVADRHGTWRSCKLDITKCSSAQLQTMQEFRTQFMKAVSGVGNSPARGMFIDACYAHCQTGTQETWLRADSPVLGNTSIAKAIGDWYFERSGFQKTDCAYPCNPTCHNRVFDGN